MTVFSLGKSAVAGLSSHGLPSLWVLMAAVYFFFHLISAAKRTLRLGPTPITPPGLAVAHTIVDREV